MMCVELILGGDSLHELVFDLGYIPPHGHAGPIGDAENMGIYGDDGLMKYGIQHYVGGFSTNAR